MEQEGYYHIYNHANGIENLFRTDENYHYFLKRYSHFIYPVADTFAYCLMPNHFHFLIKTKELVQISEVSETSDVLDETIPNLKNPYSKAFSDLFNSYTKAYNKMFNRRGSLFNRQFKRKAVENDEYFTKLIHYIHANSVHHGFVNTIEDWPFSSYHAFLSNKASLLNRNEILELFHGKEDFVKFHKQPIDLKIDLEM